MDHSRPDWQKLKEEHEIAYLRGELAAMNPESYSDEEARKIFEDMEASTKAIDDAMRAEFEALPIEARAMLLDRLAESGTEDRAFWEQILLGFDDLPDSPPEP